MLVGCHLQPGSKQDVSKIAATASSSSSSSAPSGELHITGAYLSEGKTGALFVHTPAGQRLAVAHLTEDSPSTRLILQFNLEHGSHALEAVGGKLDILGFLDDTDARRLEEATGQQASAKAAAKKQEPSTPKVEPRKEPEAKKLQAEKKPETKTVEAKKPEAPEAAKNRTKEFIPTMKFIGAKPGMVFKKGAKGMGYYKDTYVKPPPLDLKAVKRKAENAPADQPASKKMSLAGGLQYETMKAAPAGAAKATRGRTVQVRYDGRLASNGQRFDKGTIKFKLGAGEVIRGWDVGVDGMKVGEKRRLLIPSKLAYGSSGAPPDIPRNANLCFEVELLKV